MHYKSDQGSTHNDSREDALQTLKDLHNQTIKRQKSANTVTKEEIDLNLESQLSEALAELEEARFEKGQDIGKPNTGKDTGFKNLEKKLTPKYGKESAKKIAGSVLQKILHK